MTAPQSPATIQPIEKASPEAQSANLVEGNLAQLKALFPEAFTEGRIDFEVLKQLLGAAVDEREEKYGLNWHGKRRARQLALAPSTGAGGMGRLPFAHMPSVGMEPSRQVAPDADVEAPSPCVKTSLPEMRSAGRSGDGFCCIMNHATTPITAAIAMSAIVVCARGDVPPVGVFGLAAGKVG